MIPNLEAAICSAVSPCWRVVETQEKAATRDITANAHEQSRLEELLDSIKPVIPEDCRGLSYLLMTPFRYPPLRYGSRFGSEWERGVFYGAVELETAFAESAVYFWLFQGGPTELGPLARIRDHRSAILTRLSSQSAVKLESPVFESYQTVLSDPASWQFTQGVGEALRKLNVDFITYTSARWPSGTNTAVFSPRAFITKEPDAIKLWNVIFTEDSCWFGSPEGQSYEFYRGDFESEGRIPHPSLL